MLLKSKRGISPDSIEPEQSIKAVLERSLQ